MSQRRSRVLGFLERGRLTFDDDFKKHLYKSRNSVGPVARIFLEEKNKKEGLDKKVFKNK